MTTTAPHVGLLVTCLVDAWRPSVGFAAARLLERAGCRVSVPATQTCCGQPAYNTGDRSDARAIARQVIETFETFDYVVVPSGSCGGMLRCHFGGLFADDPAMTARAQALAAKSWELISFLTDICGIDSLESGYEGCVTYHDGCSGLRELDIHDQPRRLLAALSGVSVRERQKVPPRVGS